MWTLILSNMPLFCFLGGMMCVIILAGWSVWSLIHIKQLKDVEPRLKRLDALDKDIEAKEATLQGLRAEEVKAEKTIAEAKGAQEWMEKARDDIDNRKREVAEARAKATMAKAELDLVNTELNNKRQNQAECNLQRQEAEKARDDAQKRLTEIKNEHADVEVAVTVLKAEKSVLSLEVAKLEETKTALEKENKTLDEERSRLNGEVERLKGLLESQQFEYNKVSTKVETLSDEIHRLKAEGNSAREKIEELRTIKINTAEKWKNLETPLVDVKMVKEQSILPDNQDEKAWLKKFEDSLKEHGFIFEPRTIRAFHTGLKCAMHTPLVVLSGISGTGKSLLPELYASALGMNFLSVPVQPRWDSPQDLFGFYNYMEGRYKATELARLLWQFDPYNNKEGVKDFKQGTMPLNMVLLDEMNLARVEYYFSDLLSKLETRNGLDFNDAAQRKRAEIELECNAANGINEMKRLFVSQHTLFVGTMNEDESTQMLSDKVIDRSNVLRFGRPKQLTEEQQPQQSTSSKGAFINEWNKKPRISTTLWDKWCKPLVDSGRSDSINFLQTTIRPVIEALDNISRPYGFRVDKAMKLYVENYPGDYREAVADQIEMKLLPKLNGVKMHDDSFASVRSAMESAISETGDKQLAEAFTKACSQNGTFFKWRGVMR